jgi:SUN domain-containing protein 1/2
MPILEVLKFFFMFVQVQLEVIDMKIGKEANEIRDEMKQKFESQVAHFSTEVKGLKSQVNRRAAEGSTGHSFSLEDVRSVARRMVLTEIEKHAADGIGRADYALASGGGRIIDHSEGYMLSRTGDWSTMAFSMLPGATRRHPLAQKVLEPSFGEPGQCLPLKGSNVFVEISLRTAIHPDAVTLEHVSKVTFLFVYLLMFNFYPYPLTQNDFWSGVGCFAYNPFSRFSVHAWR